MGVLGERLCWQVVRAAQISAMIVFGAMAAAMVVSTLCAAVGVLPWLSVPIEFLDGTTTDAGIALQTGLSLLGLLMTAYMPANFRILALENSHRTFRMRMEDVANAYWAAHEADRTGLFQLKSEYDAVRERMAFLHEHPDLGALEPELLEVAAQMSRTSEELALRYSDEKVGRAKRFLAEREAEAAQMQDRIETALVTVHDIRRWLDRVESEEDMAKAHLTRLTSELETLLPRLGLSLGPARDDRPAPDIIPLSPRRPKTRARGAAGQ